MGFTRFLGGILFLVLLHSAQALIPPGSYSVTLTWDGSPGGDVVGYNVYYGPASGVYTNTTVVGNVTTHTVSGLTGGAACFVAVTAYDATGLESAFSNEIGFTPGSPRVRIRMAPAGQSVLTVSGLIGHTYDLQATENFGTWTIIGAVTVGPGGSVDFTDLNAANFPTRFYRTHDTQP